MIVDNNNKFIIAKMTCHSLEQGAMKNRTTNARNPYIKFNNELIAELRGLKELQGEDGEIGIMKEKLSSEGRIREEGGILYLWNGKDKKWKLIIPRGIIDSVRRAVHEQFCHAGAYKMVRYIDQYFYWRHLRRDIKNFSRSCDVCQRAKCLNQKTEGAYLNVTASRPNELIAVDFYWPLPGSTAGVKYIFVICGARR